MRQKRILFTAACILAAVGAMAQGNGQAVITEATQIPLHSQMKNER